MHRITWRVGGESASTFVANGFVALPTPIAEAFAARGIAALPQHAILLTAAGPVPLPPGQPTVCPTGERLTWDPETDAVCAPLPFEPTVGEPPRIAPGALALVTPGGDAHPVTAVPLLVGRHPGCDVHCDDRRVSSYHCAIQRQGDCIRVFDLASTNGTYVDGLRIEDASLARGARVRVGQTVLMLTNADAPNDAIVLPSAAMASVMQAVRRLGPSNAPVHLHGESGVGKEVIARELHRQSGRSGPFIAINAAGLSPALAQSELFGHTRGAFTGAERHREGAFVAAHEGTLFLDEIAELPLEMQAELLRAVELGLVRPVGESCERAVDVRIVTATHRDLAACVRAGRFREDLYHRLCVIPLVIPPLRERPEDIEALAVGFLARHDPTHRLSPRALAKLLGHRWTGNVRELFNTLRRACVFCEREVIDADDLEMSPAVLQESAVDIETLLAPKVLEVYGRTGGSLASTARQLGLKRNLVQKLLKAGQQRRLALS